MLSLQDERDITDVVVRYADAMDKREWERFRTCFSDDFTADYGAFTTPDGDHFTKFMRDIYADLGQALHRLTNIVITGDGDKAGVRSYINGVSMAKDGTLSLETEGFFDDTVIRTKDGWKIQRRRFTPVSMRGPHPAVTKR
jgi:hypothetical protein